jgi:non-ribosomal peptide synthetase component F
VGQCRDKRGRVRHDGAFACTLCAERQPDADNDWCPITRSVVCDDCCRELMMAEERVTMAASAEIGHPFTPEDIVAACMACPRLARLVHLQALENAVDVRRRMH